MPFPWWWRRHYHLVISPLELVWQSPSCIFWSNIPDTIDFGCFKLANSSTVFITMNVIHPFFPCMNLHIFPLVHKYGFLSCAYHNLDRHQFPITYLHQVTFLNAFKTLLDFAIAVAMQFLKRTVLYPVTNANPRRFLLTLIFLSSLGVYFFRRTFTTKEISTFADLQSVVIVAFIRWNLQSFHQSLSYVIWNR